MNTRTICAADLQVGDRIYTPPSEALALTANGLLSVPMKPKRVTLPARWLTVESIERKLRKVYVCGPQTGRKYPVTMSYGEGQELEVAR